MQRHVPANPAFTAALLTLLDPRSNERARRIANAVLCFAHDYGQGARHVVSAHQQRYPRR